MTPSTDFGLSANAPEFDPAGPPDINDAGREERDIYFVLCGSRNDLSCVNEKCAPWLESISLENQPWLSLPDLTSGEEWAILRFKTSRYESMSLHVRRS